MKLRIIWQKNTSYFYFLKTCNKKYENRKSKNIQNREVRELFNEHRRRFTSRIVLESGFFLKIQNT